VEGHHHGEERLKELDLVYLEKKTFQGYLVVTFP